MNAKELRLELRIKNRVNLAFLTSTRADFGKLRPLIAETRDAGHEPTVIACGTHLDIGHGYTLVEVEQSGCRVVQVPSAVAPVSRHGMVDALADVARGVSRALGDADALVVHGDRVEAMGGALAAALANVPVVHIEAGDVSGGIDDALRASITPLASVHVARDIASAERLRTRGIDPRRIFVIGVTPPADMPTLAEVRARYELPAWERYGVLALHPVTTGEEPPDVLAREVCAAVIESGLPFVVLASNADHGSHLIERELAQLPRERFRRIPSMRHAHFSRLLAEAAVIVGNSSTGVIEAPLYGTPCVDVGTRQRGRAEDARSVRWADVGRLCIAGVLRMAMASGEERKAHPLLSYAMPPIDETKRAEVLAALQALSTDHRAVYAGEDSWMSVLDAIERRRSDGQRQDAG